MSLDRSVSPVFIDPGRSAPLGLASFFNQGIAIVGFSDGTELSVDLLQSVVL